MDLKTMRDNAIRNTPEQNRQPRPAQSYVPSGNYPVRRRRPGAGENRAVRPGGADLGKAIGPIEWSGRRVPHFCQGDDSWKGRTLNDDDTIGSAGCGISCCAMALNYFGRPATPADVDACMDANHGYIQGSDGIADWNIALAAKASSSLTVKVDRDIRLYAGGDAAEMYRVIEESLTQNIPVIGRVKYRNKAGDYHHFVLIVGRDRDGNHIINDPASFATNGAADPNLPNVILETSTRNGGFDLVGIQSLNVQIA